MHTEGRTFFWKFPENTNVSIAPDIFPETFPAGAVEWSGAAITTVTRFALLMSDSAKLIKKVSCGAFDR